MQGIEKEDSEEAFRRGYEHAAIETFHAIERFLDPSTREVLRTWIDKDVYVWRLNAMLGYPPTWRLKMLSGPKLSTLNHASGIGIPRSSEVMTRTPSDDTKSADDAARDEILQQRPELKGKSLEAMRRILRREARLSLRSRKSIKSD